jgi:uncharacterized protein (TIGR02757 family)
MKPTRQLLESTYRRMNRPEYIHPDPLEFVLRYRGAADREVAGLIAACLAYGNVKQILRSVEKVLAPMGPAPAAWLKSTPPAGLRKALAGFKHRFTTGAEMAVFLLNIRRALLERGSLERLFLDGYRPEEPTVEQALYRFVNAFNTVACAPTLTPCPEHKSSFKRINLFLRWMVRRDAVDPGVWAGISPARLIIPLDTHMRQAAMSMGLTRRKDTSMKTAVEITGAFARFCPGDPVKYDFAITRAGIRGNNT